MDGYKGRCSIGVVYTMLGGRYKAKSSTPYEK